MLHEDTLKDTPSEDNYMVSTYARRHNLSKYSIGKVLTTSSNDYIQVDWDNGFSDGYPNGKLYVRVIPWSVSFVVYLDRGEEEGQQEG